MLTSHDINTMSFDDLASLLGCYGTRHCKPQSEIEVSYQPNQEEITSLHLLRDASETADYLIANYSRQIPCMKFNVGLVGDLLYQDLALGLRFGGLPSMPHSSGLNRMLRLIGPTFPHDLYLCEDCGTDLEMHTCECPLKDTCHDW